MLSLQLIGAIAAVLCIAYFAVLCLVSRRLVSGSAVWLAGALYNAAASLLASFNFTATATVLFGVELLGALIACALIARMAASARAARAEAATSPAPDWMVVLGAHVNGDQPCRLLRLRLDAACSYWKAHPAMRVMVSGGQGPNEAMPEAHVMRNYLVEHGIPDDAIVCEDASTSTLENLRNSRALIEQADGSIGKIALVTNGFHVHRALIYARKCGLDAFAIPAASTRSSLPHYALREAAALVVLKLRAL